MSKQQIAKAQSISFPGPLLKKAKQKAKRQNRTFSNYIVNLVLQDLEAVKEAA